MAISAIVNTCNEEERIEKCLKSLSWVDEIILVDMHSADRTVEIAKKYTSKIYFFEKMGYVEPARNFAIEKASNNWILIIDADEIVNDRLADELKRISSQDCYDVIYIARKNMMFGKWIKHTGWWPDYLPRFFKKGMLVYSNRIHAYPQINNARIIHLPAEEDLSIHHNAYESVAEFIVRLERYSTIEAQNMLAEGKKSNVLYMLFRSVAEFINRFFRQQGFRDGYYGFILSVLMGYYRYLSWKKLARLKKGNF